MNIHLYQKTITEELISLLLTADPDPEALSGYIDDSQIVVGELDSKIVGVAVLHQSAELVELKNIAVLAGYQGRGYAKQLIREVKRLAKRTGAKALLVGTGNSSLSQLALYQKSGFRMYEIQAGYFDSYPSPIFENGIRCLDRVLLRADL